MSGWENKVNYFSARLRSQSDNPWFNTCGWTLNDGPDRAEIMPNRATPDLFGSQLIDERNDVRICPCGQIGIGGNIYGIQRPHNRCTGGCQQPQTITESYAGIGYKFCYTSNDLLKLPNIPDSKINQWSEYLVQELESPLEIGKIYKFSFKISLGNTFNDEWTNEWGNYEEHIAIWLKYLGAMFSVSKISSEIQQIYTYSIDENNWDNINNSNFENSEIKIINFTKLDKKGDETSNNCHWMEVSGYFRACKPFRYLYIGHFNPSIRYEIGDQYKCGDKIYSTFYFIGDVKLFNVTDNPNYFPGSANCSYGSGIGQCSCENSNYKININSSPIPEGDPCDNGKCCTNISIQKDRAFSCKFNFLKLLFTYYDNQNKQKKISELVYIPPDKYNNFMNEESVSVFDLCLDRSFEYKDITVTSKLFNSTDILSPGGICDNIAGLWFGESQHVSFQVYCQCNCDDLLHDNHFILTEDPVNPCCSKLTLNNINSDCDWYIDGLYAQVYIQQPNYIFDYISDPNDLTFINNSIWGQPTYDQDNHTFYWNTPAVFTEKFIRKGQETDVTTICVPNDGKIYKIIFFSSNDGTFNNTCKSPDFFKRCYPSLPSIFCDNLTLELEKDETDPSKCCYYLYLKNIPLNCEDFYFNLYETKFQGLSTEDLRAENIPYSQGVNVSGKGRRFGPFCVDNTVYISGVRHIKVDFFFDNETFCSKNVDTEEECPNNSCCDEISVVPNQPTKGLHGECCYTFNVQAGTGDCMPTSLTITDTKDKIPPISINTYTNGTLPATPVCFTRNSGPQHLKFDFSIGDPAKHCIKDVYLSCTDDCCNEIHVNALPSPQFDNGSECCFYVYVTIDEGFECNLYKIAVYDYNDNFLYESDNAPIESGGHLFEYCVIKTAFFGDPLLPLPIKIKLLDSDGKGICLPVSAFINPCNFIVDPCKPDYDEADFILPPRKGTAKYRCPNSSVDCYVDYEYTYRHVTNGQQSIHRDVEVVNFKYNNDPLCDCFDAMRDAMLVEIFKTPEVYNEFKIPVEMQQPNVEYCFTNFRVISNDCWRWHTREDGRRVYTTYCPTDECCYASFTVCYVKDLNNNITMTRYFQNSPAYSMPEQCPQGCSSRNCEKWFPDLVHGREFSEENLIENKDVICNVTAIQDINSDNINININININMECNLNGYVTLELYDLLGNLIINEKFEKNNYYVTYPLKQEINMGMYVIRVKIDDVQVFKNKILIIN